MKSFSSFSNQAHITDIAGAFVLGTISLAAFRWHAHIEEIENGP